MSSVNSIYTRVRRYGATVAHWIPDPKVGSSNLSIFIKVEWPSGLRRLSQAQLSSDTRVRISFQPFASNRTAIFFVISILFPLFV